MIQRLYVNSIQVKKGARRVGLPFLDKGEAAVIGLALQERIKTVCIDEAAGRNASKQFGLMPVGTLGVLAHLFRNNVLNRKQVMVCVDEMVRRDFRVSAKILEKFKSSI